MLNQKSKIPNRLTPSPLSQKSVVLIQYNANAPKISSKASLNNLAKVYFDSV